MKAAAIILTLMSANVGAERVIRPIMPGGIPDLTRNSIVIRGGEVYQTFPGMPYARDYTEDAYYFDGRYLYREAINGLEIPDLTGDMYEIEDMDGEDGGAEDW